MCLFLLLSLLLCGCNGLLNRSYSSQEPHSATYWENEEEDTLRADSYQDLVNALLLLVGEGSADATVRLYGQAGGGREFWAEQACNEVQNETPTGAYLLDYIAYSGTEEKDYYELRVRFGYRRTAQQQSDLVGVTNAEAIPQLLRQAYEEEQGELTVRMSNFPVDRAGVEALVWQTQRELLGLAEEELTAGELWRVTFYPNTDRAGIIEILLEGTGEMENAEETEQMPESKEASGR